MRLEDVERYLDRGSTLGFARRANNPGCLGWILVSKQKPNERVLSLFAPGENDDLVRREEMVRARPYLVRIVELTREAYESDRYEANEDYRVYEGHRFSRLEEVQAFVQGMGHRLQEIKWLPEISPP